jgi:hypothetical protein
MDCEDNIAAINIPTTPPLPPDPPISITHIQNSEIYISTPVKSNMLTIHGIDSNQSFSFCIYNTLGQIVQSGNSNSSNISLTIMPVYIYVQLE